MLFLEKHDPRNVSTLPVEHIEKNHKKHILISNVDFE